jgi:hypothetical protein
VGEVLRRFGDEFLGRHATRLTVTQRKVLASLAACRTPAMGYRRWECDACGHQALLPRSCGDRHCPQCQGSARQRWLNQRRAELLPVDYYHVVFTVPRELAGIAAAHPRQFYTLLFRAVRETLVEVAADGRHLGAKIGGLMVLHTWGQTLQLHPHVHVIVPGGGLTPDGQRWVSCPPKYFLCVKVLGRVFRGKLLAFLRDAYQAGQLPFTGGLAHLAQPARFAAWRKALFRGEWNVYCQPPCGGPERVLKYLARYTYRVAISNDRLEAISHEGIRFRYKDYQNGGDWRSMTLSADEFLRRFAQHILPRGLVRIRSFGYLAGPRRNEQLARCRELISASGTPAATDSQVEKPATETNEPPRCPHCQTGLLVLIEQRPRPRVPELVGLTYQPGGLAGLTKGWNTS